MNIFGFTGTVCRGHDGNPSVKSGDTRKGSMWAQCNLAVYNHFKKESEFYQIASYGKLAEILLRANAGDQISAAGRVEQYDMERQGVKYKGYKFVAEKITLARGTNMNQHRPPEGVEDESYAGPMPKGSEGYADDPQF